MEKKKLTKRQSGHSTKKSTFLKRICDCIFKSDESEDNSTDTEVKSDKNHVESNATKKHLKSNKRSSSCMTDFDTSAAETTLSLRNDLLQVAGQSTATESTTRCHEGNNANKERMEQVTQRSPFTQSNNLNFENKERTNVLVKTILSKYLEMKSAQVSNNLPDNENKLTILDLIEPRRSKSPTVPDDLNVEYFSSSEIDDSNTANEENNNQTLSESGEAPRVKVAIDSEHSTNVECSSYSSSKTVIPESSNKEESSKPTGDFPAKTKSAPTNSTAHDSLADICTKFSRFKNQENQPENHGTCTSDDDTSNYKKKLELIFDKSSEEILSNYEDGSGISLQYTISCERTPVVTGISRQDSVLQHCMYEKNYDCVREISRSSTITSRELRIQPSARGELNGYTDSTTSLKWKLIISHHKDLK